MVLNQHGKGKEPQTPGGEGDSRIWRSRNLNSTVAFKTLSLSQKNEDLISTFVEPENIVLDRLSGWWDQPRFNASSSYVPLSKLLTFPEPQVLMCLVSQLLPKVDKKEGCKVPGRQEELRKRWLNRGGAVQCPRRERKRVFSHLLKFQGREELGRGISGESQNLSVSHRPSFCGNLGSHYKIESREALFVLDFCSLFPCKTTNSFGVDRSCPRGNRIFFFILWLCVSH